MGKLARKGIGELRDRVQDRLDSESRKLGFRLKVVEAFEQDEDIHGFIVVPEKPGIRAYDYAEVLTKVEIAFREGDGLNILLVPARPD